MTSMTTEVASSIRDTIGVPLKLNTKPGDKILIISDTAMDGQLWQEMFAAAQGMGLEPTMAMIPPRSTHAKDPTGPVLHAARDPELDLVVYLTSTALAHAPITEELMDRGKKVLLLEEITPAMLAPNGPAGADYVAMAQVGARVAEAFTRGKRVRVQSDLGTDLTAVIDGRPGRSYTATIPVMNAKGGGGCGFPDGEAHVCPIEGTGEGVVVLDLTAHSTGRLEEPIRLIVEKGMVTRIEGGRGAAIWRDILEKHGDANSFNCPAEIAVGLNPLVTPTGSMRTDKKMYGSSHIGMGDTIVLGGTCHAKLRLEGVIRQPLITVDGQVITRDGQILV
jgi:2,5-dihydroxypyridine 5,6-dioxygenase